jgi:hypothetical protein
VGAERRPRTCADGQGTAQASLPSLYFRRLIPFIDGNSHVRPCSSGCHDLRGWLPAFAAIRLTVRTGRPKLHRARRHELPLAAEQLVGGRGGKRKTTAVCPAAQLTAPFSFRTRLARCWPLSGRRVRLGAPAARSTPSSSKPLREPQCCVSRCRSAPAISRTRERASWWVPVTSCRRTTRADAFSARCTLR